MAALGHPWVLPFPVQPGQAVWRGEEDAQPHLPLGGLAAAFDTPACARHLRQGLQRRALGGIHEVGLVLDRALTVQQVRRRYHHGRQPPDGIH